MQTGEEIPEQEQTPSEEWRPVVGYEGWYEVSDVGNVRRVDSGRLLKLGKSASDYSRVSLSVDGRPVSYDVHCLVARAFIGECLAGLEVNHKNGVRTDNRPDNLEYVTRSENALHRNQMADDRKWEGMRARAKATNGSLKIEEVPLDSLVPYARNARKLTDREVDGIAASIAEFGYDAPIIVDGENVIIAGHGRYAALKKLGHQTVKVVVQDGLTKQQAAARRLIDNRQVEMREYDGELLALELSELELDLTPFEVDFAGLLGPAPVFQPSELDERGQSDERTKATCPNCGHEFEPS